MENIEKIMSVYCLFDKETSVYDCFIISYDDKDARDYFIENLALIAKELSIAGDLKKYNSFIDRIKNSCVMRLAQFDNVKGLFNNEQVVLLDYLDEQALIDYYKSRENLQNKFNKENN